LNRCDEKLRPGRNLEASGMVVTVMRNGQPIELSAREWAVLENLMHQASRVVSKQQIIDAILPCGVELTLNAVEVYISRVRLKITSSNVVIRTIREFGYMLEEAKDHAQHPVKPAQVAVPAAGVHQSAGWRIDVPSCLDAGAACIRQEPGKRGMSPDPTPARARSGNRTVEPERGDAAIDRFDAIYHAVRDSAGKTIAGDKDFLALPLPQELDTPLAYDHAMRGKALRLAPLNKPVEERPLRSAETWLPSMPVASASTLNNTVEAVALPLVLACGLCDRPARRGWPGSLAHCPRFADGGERLSVSFDVTGADDCTPTGRFRFQILR
jgi:DNA-binding winged helix-turn-helix (wHTH) protein